MNLLADESVDRQIVQRLRRDGHRVVYVAEAQPGMPDGDVLALADHEAALLLTADKDFGEIVYRQRLHTRGIVLIHLAGLPPEHKAELVALAIREHADELTDAFTVIAPGACRIRRSVG